MKSGDILLRTLEPVAICWNSANFLEFDPPEGLPTYTFQSLKPIHLWWPQTRGTAWCARRARSGRCGRGGTSEASRSAGLALRKDCAGASPGLALQILGFSNSKFPEFDFKWQISKFSQIGNLQEHGDGFKSRVSRTAFFKIPDDLAELF